MDLSKGIRNQIKSTLEVNQEIYSLLFTMSEFIHENNLTEKYLKWVNNKKENVNKIKNLKGE